MIDGWRVERGPWRYSLVISTCLGNPIPLVRTREKILFFLFFFSSKKIII